MSDDAAASRDQKLPRAGFALLAALSIFWGLNWPGMKIILAEVPVWWFRASCVVVGGTFLLAISGVAGNRVALGRKEIPLVALCGLFNVCGWHVMSAYGVSLMPAGRASIIAFTMPVWAALFAIFLLGDRMTSHKVLGLVLGVCALAVLIGPDLIVVQQAPVGALFMLGAAISWGFGTALFKRLVGDLPVASHIGWQLLLSAVPIGAVAVATEPLPDVRGLSFEAVVALVYIYGFPMTFCQWAYFKTVHICPAPVAAIGTLMVPVVGVYSSYLILAEPVGWREFAALLLTCLALFAVLVLPGLRMAGSVPSERSG